MVVPLAVVSTVKFLHIPSTASHILLEPLLNRSGHDILGSYRPTHTFVRKFGASSGPHQ
jgi:hypothetical protein